MMKSDSEFNKEIDKEAKTWTRLRSAMGHVGLLVALMTYTAVGGMVFRELEYPAEVEHLESLHRSVFDHRRHLIDVMARNANLTKMVAELTLYEDTLQEAIQGGLTLPLRPANPSADARWNFLQAVFFASTVLTTIGYGNIVPVTFWGRVFCVLFALIGLPLTLSVIADMGHLFAMAVSALYARFRQHLPTVPHLQHLTETGRRSLTAVAAVIFLFLYLAAGAGIFMLWEEEWGFFEGFYFCFITMTTIGFGDLVPKKPKYMLICTVYILVGLALTSTIIELVQRQYSESWRRLQALSGPLAETLRRLGESAGGSMDLASLQRIMTMVSGSKRFQGGPKGEKQRREWEEAMAAVLRDMAAPSNVNQQPVLQIVIYESSV